MNILKSSFKNNFKQGMGSILDIFPSPPKSLMANKSPQEFIKESFEQVGNDIRDSMKRMDDELHFNKD